MTTDSVRAFQAIVCPACGHENEPNEVAEFDTPECLRCAQPFIKGLVPVNRFECTQCQKTFNALDEAVECCASERPRFNQNEIDRAQRRLETLATHLEMYKQEFDQLVREVGADVVQAGQRIAKYADEIESHEQREHDSTRFEYVAESISREITRLVPNSNFYGLITLVAKIERERAKMSVLRLKIERLTAD